MNWIYEYIHVWAFIVFLLGAVAFNEYRNYRKSKMSYYRDLKDYCRDRMMPIPSDPEIELLYKQGFMKDELGK